MSKYDEVITLLDERFGKDTVISLATIGLLPTATGSRPAVRNVNSFYADGAYLHRYLRNVQQDAGDCV